MKWPHRKHKTPAPEIVMTDFNITAQGPIEWRDDAPDACREVTHIEWTILWDHPDIPLRLGSRLTLVITGIHRGGKWERS